MPRLRAFGKEWATGSDDLTIPAAINGLVSGSWFGSLLYFYMRQRHSLDCVGGESIHTFYTCGLVISGLETLILAGVIRISLKGTLINWTPRSNLQNWIGARLCIQALGAFFSVYSIHLAYYQQFDCNDFIINNLKGACKYACVSTVISFLSLVAMARGPLKKDSHHGHPHASSTELLHELEHQQDHSTFSIWHYIRSRYRSLKTVLKGFLRIQPDPTLSKVSNFFTSYFEDDLDLVPGDILMALLIVSKRQNENRRRRTFSHDDMIDTGSVHPQPWMRDPALLSHYFKFAYGAYGWWPYFVMSERWAMWNLFKIVIKGRYIPRGLPSFITGDNRLLANTTALQILTKLPMKDLVYVSFSNERFELPFFVALDHKHKAIVVSIRGTLSIEDTIVDLYCFSEPMPNHKGEAHVGMLESAIILKKKLVVENEGSSFENGHPLLKVAYEKLSGMIGESAAKEYGLVITGHSLGAGTAGVLAVLMRDVPGYENLKCFAFSPPGGLMSPDVAKYAEGFVCSVVLGDDIVGRLGLTQAFGFKAKILKTLKTCDIAKHNIFGDWLESVLSTLLRIPKRKQEKNQEPSWARNPEAEKQVLDFQQHIQSAFEEAEKEKHRVALQPPGCVIFITEKQSSTFPWFGQKSSYEAFFTPCCSRMFSKILLMPDMLRHHLPWEVMKAVDSLAEHDKRPLLKDE